MNRFEKNIGKNGEARLRYMAGDLHVLQPGSFVICAASGEKIPLADLRYWSVELQEPYASAELSLERKIKVSAQR